MKKIILMLVLVMSTFVFAVGEGETFTSATATNPEAEAQAKADAIIKEAESKAKADAIIREAEAKAAQIRKDSETKKAQETELLAAQTRADEIIKAAQVQAQQQAQVQQTVQQPVAQQQIIQQPIQPFVQQQAAPFYVNISDEIKAAEKRGADAKERELKEKEEQNKRKYYFYINFGIENSGRYSPLMDDSGTLYGNGSTKDVGGQFAMEFTKVMNKNTELGLGMAFQAHALGNDYTNKYTGITYEQPQYASMALYMLGKFNFGTFIGLTPYIKGSVGYSNNEILRDLKVKEDTIIPATQKYHNHDSNNSDEYYDEYSEDNWEMPKDKVTDGVMLGIGAGFEFKNAITFDWMYMMNTGDYVFNQTDINGVTTSSKRTPLDYGSVVCSIGIKF
ncbi:MAG: DivIVA domain-containing protein [Fusobacteriaceae bacterium]